MKIIIDRTGEYPDVVSGYFNLKRFDDNSSDQVLFDGYNTTLDQQLKQRFWHYKKRAYLNLESPSSFMATRTTVEDMGYFTHVYNICPYTSKWLGQISIPFPIVKEMALKEKKIYDVMYMGTVICPDHIRMVDVIKRFNHVFTSLYMNNDPIKPTHIGIGIEQRTQLLAQSKISVCLNQAQIKKRYIRYIKSYNNWQSHEAFSDIDSGIVPQYKSRVAEAMVQRTLNLVRRDSWNVIEHWFKPDKHFIYWDSFDDLHDKISEISRNFGGYQHIINSAYKEVQKHDIDYIYKNVICV